MIARRKCGEAYLVVWDQAEACRIQTNITTLRIRIDNARSIGHFIGRDSGTIDFPGRLSVLAYDLCYLALQGRHTPTELVHRDVEVTGKSHFLVSAAERNLFV
jgi:hypothetical protein